MELKSFLIWTILTGFLDSMIRGHSSSLCLVPHESGKSSVCKERSDALKCERGKVIMITKIEFAKTAEITGGITCNKCSRDSVIDIEIRPSMFLAKLYQACSHQNRCKLKGNVNNPEASGSEYVWFADITYDCIESEQSDGPTSLHITLNQATPDKVMFVSCTCIIDGAIRLLAVDYRPYINDLKCATTAALFIDGEQMFRCLDDSSNDFSVYNEEIPVTSNLTNVTTAFDGPPPQMLWLQITGSSGVSLVCYQKIYDSDHQTSQHTSTAMSDTTASPSVTDTFQKDNYEGEPFQIPMIVGIALSLLALIVIIIIICAVYKRRKSRMAQTKTMTNEHSAVSFEPQRPSEITLTKGVENKSYEEASGNISSNSPSNYQEVCTDNVYAEPVDVIADDVYYCEPAETDVDSQNTLTMGNNNGVHDYQEQYDKSVLTKGEESQCNYTKVVKENKKEDVYNAFTGVDNYSHIHVISDKRLPQHLDNYSHIKLQCEQRDATQSHSNDMYTHLKVEQNSPDNFQCNPVQGDKACVETVEYDHLAHYSHH